ncbi:MAG: calcium/sodium antiporter [Candidatus Thermoplasmatota archaeon]|nr:calcium/sodium antiporter [Candidatus Thermoplasmatota archaeon]
MLAITNLPVAILLCALGILFLYVGGESLVKGSAQTAFRLGVKPLFIALTVVAYGTSLPEFGVSLIATLANHTEIAIGNIVGSVICNILLVLGISAMIRPLKIEKDLVKREAPIMVIATLILVLFSFKLVLDRFAGAVLLACFSAYIIFFIRCAKKSIPKNNYAIKAKSMWLNIVFIIGGLVGVILGARLLVDSAVFIAHFANVPETIIALTLVAVGTSLPELAVSGIATCRGHADISVGNIIGSNIFNVLLILGACSLVTPLLITSELFVNMLISLLVCTVIIPLLYTGYKLSRVEGTVLLMCYALYLAYLYYG